MSEKAKVYGSGSGTDFGFTVEVRTTFDTPTVHPLTGMIIDKEWRRVPYRLETCDKKSHDFLQSGRIGEIAVWNYSHETTHLHLMDWGAAYTLGCQFLGQIHMPLCIEFRIVRVKVVYKYESSEDGLGEPISMYKLKDAMKYEKPATE